MLLKNYRRFKFLSTPSARRATEDAAEKLPAVQISIHALREEGDTKAYANGGETCHFYPRPPRGGRPKPTHPRKKAHQFLSTPSARRATICRMMRSRTLWISIHALREEGDTWI